MKSLNTILLGVLIAATVACGYSKNNSTPPPSQMPAISQLNPTSTSHGDPTFMLTVNGSNFASNASVNWNGTGQPTTRVTAGQLTISVPASAVANAGTAQITVTNPATTGIYGSPAKTSAPVAFTIN
jgi:outer membrane lipopolysaccharide assembly protein LptE/RlpB